MRTLRAALAALAIFFLPLAAAAHDLWFPTEAPLTEFSDSYGAPRVGHRHQGNDLMAPKGSRVFAAASGTISRVREHGSAGRYIVIDHGDWSTWYMHLNNDEPGTDCGCAGWDETVVVEVGDEVQAGDLIGFVGDSGNAEGTAPHTHFEMHVGGRAVDPHPDLVDAYEEAMEIYRVLQWVHEVFPFPFFSRSAF